MMDQSEERLPDEGEPVIVFNSSYIVSEIYVAYLEGLTTWILAGAADAIPAPTHWQPLPEPPTSP